MTSCEPESPLVPSTTTNTNDPTDGSPTSSTSCTKRTGGVFSKPSFVTQMQKHKVRTVKTLCLYLAYTALGMATGMSGPTILDLQLTVDSTYEQITFILPGRSLGYALGSFIGKCIQLPTLCSPLVHISLLTHKNTFLSPLVGLTYSLINTQLLISLCCGASAVFLAVLPFNRTLYGLIGTFFANGLVNGMLDTGSNMFLLVIWGKENAPFMQALHFAFGMGALYAPLLAKPFLLPHVIPFDVNDTLLMDENDTLIVDPDFVQIKHTVDDVELEIPYGINGLFMLINCVIFMALYSKYRVTKPHPSRVMANVLDKMGGGFTIDEKESRKPLWFLPPFLCMFTADSNSHLEPSSRRTQSKVNFNLTSKLVQSWLLFTGDFSPFSAFLPFSSQMLFLPKRISSSTLDSLVCPMFS